MLDSSDFSAIQSLLEKTIDKRLKPLAKDIRKIRTDLEMVTGEFDKDLTDTRKRVSHIETHLNISRIS